MAGREKADTVDVDGINGNGYEEPKRGWNKNPSVKD